tara:strand:+ start:32 stop:703 length:672 start_codon:yes stop_codon:yes gene_type:complete
MAHARIIRQNFFNEPIIAEKYSVKERYLLIGLACAADDFGRFWCNAANIRAGIFPTDEKISSVWVDDSIKKFTDDLILCQYEVDNTPYAHFPKWFHKGWYLKQRVDHPREYQSPDCPICETERNKREISRTIKSNKIKKNENKLNIGKDNIIQQLTSHHYFSKMLKKYFYITKVKYKEAVGDYVNWVNKHDAFDRNHEREFEGRLMGLHEKIELKNNVQDGGA